MDALTSFREWLAAKLTPKAPAAIEAPAAPAGAAPEPATATPSPAPAADPAAAAATTATEAPAPAADAAKEKTDPQAVTAPAPAATDPAKEKESAPAAAAPAAPEPAAATTPAAPAATPPAASTEPAATEADRAELARYLEVMGQEDGLKAYLGKIPFAEAVLEHHAFLKAENAALRARLEALGQAGSDRPAAFSPVADGLGQKAKTFKEAAEEALAKAGKE